MKLELGQTVFIVKDNKIKEGRIAGYEAKFLSEWNEWMKSWVHTWGDEKHELLAVYVNFPSETRIDGTVEKHNKNVLFLKKEDAEKQIEKAEKENKKRIEEEIDRLKKLI